MALIFSPLTEDILEGPFKPYPRGVFIMLQDNKGTPEVDREMDSVVCNTLKVHDFKPLKATTKRGTKDFLEKIVQIIRGCGFGVAIFSQYTAASSLANIFFEVGLCNMLGKPVILVKNKDSKSPSDFVRTEWVTYLSDKNKLESDFEKSIQAMKDLADYFENLGDLAFEAEERDYELAFERFKQSILITGNVEVKQKINRLLLEMDGVQKEKIGLEASRKRLRKAITEFSKLLY